MSLLRHSGRGGERHGQAACRGPVTSVARSTGEGHVRAGCGVLGAPGARACLSLGLCYTELASLKGEPWPPDPCRDPEARPPPRAFFAGLDFSQLTKRNPPGASSFGSPGPGRICSCNSSILFFEQSQQASAKSPSRRVRDNSITCTMALSVTRAPFLYRCPNAHSATALLMVGTSGVCTWVLPW